MTYFRIFPSGLKRYVRFFIPTTDKSAHYSPPEKAYYGLQQNIQVGESVGHPLNAFKDLISFES
jgi:hypothetical protein